MITSTMPSFIETHTQWWVAGAIVVLGLIVYGWADLKRFSLKRSWAVSKVAFAESIRRKVLWITPLAILGVIVVSQLQKPTDEQDAIRQTIKYSLFATGMLVTVTAIILACTNLPREIDTRVIYTIVTKPTTRLEIVLGKVIGFAKVSAAILLIMGVFTFGYLHLRAWSLRRDIQDRLAAGAIDPMSRATYEYWAANGLLSSRTFARPVDLQVFARLPQANDNVRWFYGSGEGDFVVPFRLSEDDLRDAAGVAIRFKIAFAESRYRPASADPSEDGSLPVGVAAPRADVSVQILDENFNTLVDPRELPDGGTVQLTDPAGGSPALLILPPHVLPSLIRSPIFFVHVSGGTRGVEYAITAKPDPEPTSNTVCLVIVDPQGGQRRIAPVLDPNNQLPALPSVRARMGNYGQQLRGGKPEMSPVAVFKFRGAPPRGARNTVGCELRCGIEKNVEESQDEAEPTKVEVTVVNQGGNTSLPVYIYPENNRTFYFDLPADALAGGDFDVCVRNVSEGHFVGLQRLSIAIAASDENFNLNLLKSLGILWMLSILVVVISIFCSTWLSWPIAIVLTLVMLLGHWGVQQLQDTLAPGIGNQIATEMFGSGSAPQSKVVSSIVEGLTKILNGVARVLPDIGQFSAIEHIEMGVTIPAARLIAPLLVLAAFGIPLLVLSYVIFRLKEVAP
jgi:hypothetical protein